VAIADDINTCRGCGAPMPPESCAECCNNICFGKWRLNNSDEYYARRLSGIKPPLKTRAAPRKVDDADGQPAQICEECGTLFPPRSNRGRYCGYVCMRRAVKRRAQAKWIENNPEKYAACRAKAVERKRKPPAENVCRHCSQLFLAPGKRRYCSTKCEVRGAQARMKALRERQEAKEKERASPCRICGVRARKPGTTLCGSCQARQDTQRERDHLAAGGLSAWKVAAGFAMNVLLNDIYRRRMTGWRLAAEKLAQSLKASRKNSRGKGLRRIKRGSWEQAAQAAAQVLSGTKCRTKNTPWDRIIATILTSVRKRKEYRT
jgi:hypothetical protein